MPEAPSRLNEAALAMARALEASAADQWEVAAAQTDSVSVGVKEGKVDQYQESSALGLAVRVLRGGRPGFAYLVGSSDADACAEAVDRALAAAAVADPEEGLSLAGQAGHLAEVETYDPELAELGVARRIELAHAVAQAAREADPRVVHVHPAEFESEVSHFRLITSLGLDAAHASTSCGAGAVAVAAEGGEQEMGWDGDGVCFLADLDVPRIGERAGQKAAASLGAGPVADGRWDVVLDPEAARTFLGILAQSLMGDNLAKGRSLLAGRLGQEVISPLVDVVDDGLRSRGLGTSPFDDEGTPQGRTVLVEGGVLHGFVYDRLWAARAGAASTGNAVRAGLKAPPGVGFTNLCILPGREAAKDLAAKPAKCLVIDNILGGHTADPVSGQFSFGASGRLVEGGQVVRAVKSIAIAGQVVEVFKAVRAVGADLRFQGRTGSPSLLVEGLSVSGP